MISRYGYVWPDLSLIPTESIPIPEAIPFKPELIPFKPESESESITI